MSKFKDLKVWQKAIELVTEVYSITNSLPAEEKYGISSQIRRCSVSIPSNIAEGAGRTTNKDFSHFLDIAKGSSFELETQLIISTNLGYLDKSLFNNFNTKLNEVQRMITGLQKSLSNN